MNDMLAFTDEAPQTAVRPAHAVQATPSRMDEHTLQFQPSEALTLGVEIELQLIDPVSLGLTSKAEALLNACAHVDGLKSEFYLSTVELCTGICADAHEAEAGFQRDIPQIIKAAAALDIGLSSTGCHPFSHYNDCAITRSERYDQVLERHQWLSRRMTVFGLHVHLGMTSGEECIRFHNGFLRYLPHLLALSASSPFWQGIDTGLASCRPTAYEALPTAGHPYRLRDWQEFEDLNATLMRSGSIQSPKDLWWDLRPSPSHGTLELRICDGLATLSETIAMTAFAHTLAHAIAEKIRHCALVVPPPRWMVRDNKWRVMRHGLDADIIVDGQGATRPIRSELLELFKSLEPIVTQLGYEKHFAVLRSIIAHGNSSTRQRAAFNARTSMEDVVRFNVAEFCAGQPKWPNATAGGVRAA
jgi:glutamate---cysteine ligase / carboxylate-amine ligase